MPVKILIFFTLFSICGSIEHYLTTKQSRLLAKSVAAGDQSVVSSLSSNDLKPFSWICPALLCVFPSLLVYCMDIN